MANSINVDIYTYATCGVCGNKLGIGDTDVNDTDISIQVDACDKCIAVMYDDAYKDGCKDSETNLDATIVEALDGIDYADLFKESKQYDTIKDVIKLLRYGGCEAALDKLNGLL